MRARKGGRAKERVQRKGCKERGAKEGAQRKGRKGGRAKERAQLPTRAKKRLQMNGRKEKGVKEEARRRGTQRRRRKARKALRFPFAPPALDAQNWINTIKDVRAKKKEQRQRWRFSLKIA